MLIAILVLSRAAHDGIINLQERNGYPPLGISKSGNRYFKEQGITQTVLKKNWNSLNNGLYKVYEVFNKYSEDYNKIKHGNVTISSLNAIFDIEFDIENEFDNFICAIVCNNKSEYTIRTFTFTESIRKYVSDIQLISAHVSTLILRFTTTHYEADKEIISEIDGCKEYIKCYSEEI